MVDISPSDYTAMLHYQDNDRKIYVWITEHGASLMYGNEIGTLYKVEFNCAVKLYELLLTGGEPVDSLSLEAENDIISVKVFGTGNNGLPLYTFTDSSDTLIFYSAMKHASKLKGLFSMAGPDYRLDVKRTNGSREVMFWLSTVDALFHYRDNPNELYQVRHDDFLKLRTLFEKYIVPIEEVEELQNTDDIDLILKYPAPDMAYVQPVQEGLGCWAVENRGALDALLSSAGGKVEFILPSDTNLILKKAILRDCSDISVYYRDEATGNAVIYSAINGNRDVYPWETGWKKAKINGHSCYKLVLDRPGSKAVLIYLQYEGWTIIEQLIGDASGADIERCLKLDIYSWNDSRPPMEPGKPLIEGNGNIDKALSAAGEAAFEQHRNSFYESVHTSDPENLKRFLFERLGFKEYYYYDGSDEELPLDRVNVEYDGERVTFLLGSVQGDEYKSFSYATGGCPSVLGEVNITALPAEIKDCGSIALGGVTYYYSVTQNYKKYITNITWEEDGVRFSITTRSSRMQTVDDGVISDWVSHVKREPLR